MKAFSIMAFFLLVISAAFAQGAITIYKSDACSHCRPYLAKLIPALESAGYSEIKTIDFINSPAQRANLASLQQKFGVPLRLQGHMVTEVGGRFLLEGHIPISAVSSLLANSKNLPKGLVLYQDSMVENPPEYVIYDGSSEFSCASNESPSECYKNPAKRKPLGLKGSTQLPPAQSAPTFSAQTPATAPPGAADLIIAAFMVLAPILATGYYLATREG